MLGALPLWVVLLAGCGGDRARCESDDQVLAESGSEQLSCGEAEVAVDWMHVLAGRPVGKQAPMALAGVRDRFRKDPAATRKLLADLGAERAAIVAAEGFDGAEARSRAVWRMARGKGLVATGEDALGEAVEQATAVWNTHDGDQLAMTEADIEAWILYGSLCRQVQGAGVLRISVADRVGIYNTLAERWEYGTKLDRIALTSLGPYWPDAKEKFNRASYDEQQAWVKTAPLPPPMTATSLGYLQAILEGDLTQHAASVHGKLGPLRITQ